MDACYQCIDLEWYLAIYRAAVITQCSYRPGYRYIGFSISRQSGVWHSTIVSMFVGVVIVIVSVYIRQENYFICACHENCTGLI